MFDFLLLRHVISFQVFSVSETMDYFRAIVQKDERSERALELTHEAINLNAANYTAWYYRRLCLEATNADLKAELQYVGEKATENPKNYQIWYTHMFS